MAPFVGRKHDIRESHFGAFQKRGHFELLLLRKLKKCFRRDFDIRLHRKNAGPDEFCCYCRRAGGSVQVDSSQTKLERAERSLRDLLADADSCDTNTVDGYLFWHPKQPIPFCVVIVSQRTQQAASQ